MSIADFVSLLGGLGMFLYGMNAMGDGLEKAAGKRMQQIIEALTSNVFKGVLVGVIVTALIQSSSATTVMVVGFVNAGVMTLPQAVGVILGANIGTTVTAQILRLSDIQATGVLSIFKPDFLAPLAIAIGAGLIMFAKRKRAKDIGQILAGFGVLFIGMDIMEGAMSHLKDKPWLADAFVSMGRQPVLGIITGAALTALIQSSSASIGILQAVAASGLVSFSSAVPIILGQNIGTCVTAMLSSIGTSKNAKRTAAVHLSFNVIGVILASVAIYGLNAIVGISGWENNITRGGIADFHTLFNLANAIVLLPFYKVLVKLAYLFVPEKGQAKPELNLLDERFLQTPAVAISQSVKMMVNMMHTVQANFSNAVGMVFNPDKTMEQKMETVNELEEIIDVGESELTKYLVKVSENDMSAEENNTVSGMFHIITDVERLGDHIVNIGEIAENMYAREEVFSPDAAAKLKKMVSAVDEILFLCVKAYGENDLEAARRIQPLEDVIDTLKTDLRQYHIQRLTRQEYGFDSGIAFLDLVNNLERMGDHCSNIGMAAEQRLKSDIFDPHQYTNNPEIVNTNEYKQLFSEYKEKYSVI